MSAENTLTTPQDAEEMNSRIEARSALYGFGDLRFAGFTALPAEIASAQAFEVSKLSHGATNVSTTQSTLGGAARLTNASPRIQEEAVHGDDVDDEQESSECGEELPREKTAAERLAEKRRMKRFRLTHNQTRYLMSEFARQPHPDAAQRSRLSKEIPGLSPRQVQVWFQNRRAKLKRLTTESDRESILRSRALPEDFDTMNILHSGQTVGTPGPTSVDAIQAFPSGEERSQQYQYRGTGESESAPSALGVFPANSNMESDSVRAPSPVSDPVSFLGGYRSPDKSFRPRSSSSAVPRQANTRRLQHDGPGTLEPSSSPGLYHPSNFGYSTLDSLAQVSTIRQRSRSAYFPSPDTRSHIKMPISATRPPHYSFHNTEEVLHLDRSTPGGALPPTPESSTASSVPAGPTSLPSTLLAFSRMHEQSPYSSGFQNFMSPAAEAHPTPTDSYPESSTPAAGPTPGSLPSGETFVNSEAKQHESYYRESTPASSSTTPQDFHARFPVNAPTSEPSNILYSPDTDIFTNRFYENPRADNRNRDFLSSRTSGMPLQIDESEQLPRPESLVTPVHTHEGWETPVAMPKEYESFRSQPDASLLHTYPQSSFQPAEIRSFHNNSLSFMEMHESPFPYGGEDIQGANSLSARSVRESGSAQQLPDQVQALPRQRPLRNVDSREPRSIPRRSQQLYPGDTASAHSLSPTASTSPAFYSLPLTPQSQNPLGQAGFGSLQSSYHSPVLPHKQTQLAAVRPTNSTSGTKRRRPREEDVGYVETAAPKRVATMPPPADD